MLRKDTLTEFTIVRLRAENSKPNSHNIPYFWENTSRDINTGGLDDSAYLKYMRTGFYNEPNNPGSSLKVTFAFIGIFLMPIFLSKVGVEDGLTLAFSMVLGAIIWIYSLYKHKKKTRLYYTAAHNFRAFEYKLRAKYPLEIMKCKLQEKELELDVLNNQKKAKKIYKKISKLQKKRKVIEEKIEPTKEKIREWAMKLKKGIRRAEEEGQVDHINPQRHNLALSPGFEWTADPHAEHPRILRYQEAIDELQKQIATLKKGETNAI